jgi:hypothetical protein
MVVEDIVSKAKFTALLHKHIAQKQGNPPYIFGPKWNPRPSAVERRLGASLEVVEVEATRHDVTDC